MPPPTDAFPTSNEVSNEQNQAPTSVADDQTAHVLFLDVVGFTRLDPPIQRLVLAKLQEIVRATENFCAARTAGELIALPTGDGMALVFLTTKGGSGAPTSCAERIAEAVSKYNETTTDEEAKINVRMGIHTGNIVQVTDVNDHPNVAGEGINTAQRVMDCGDTGHILLSYEAFHLLPTQAPNRQKQCVSLGKVKVKHDKEVVLYSLCHDQIGNPTPPEKIRLAAEETIRLGKIMDGIREAERKRNRKLLALAICLFAILAALIGLLPWAFQKPDRPITLAVLPFKPATPGKYSSRAISKGLTEDFNRSFRFLAGPQAAKSLREANSALSPSPSVQSASPSGTSPIEAARRLGVRYVLTGTVESYSDDGNLDKLSEDDPHFRVAVHAQLFDVDANGLAWEKQYTSESFKELIELQETVTREVSDKVGIKLNNDSDDANKAKAHWNYLLGRFWSFQRTYAQGETKEKFTSRAIKKYRAAKQLMSSPYNALANAGLADISLSMGGVGKDPRAARKEALEWALEATEVAQTSGAEVAEAYGAIGTAKWWLERDFLTARIAFQLAIELDPNLADIHKRYSNCLAVLGKAAEAKQEMDIALRLEPESPIFQLASGQNYFFAGEYKNAIEQLQNLTKTYPKVYDAYRFLAMALEQDNRAAEALAELHKDNRVNPESDFMSTKAYLKARLGETAEALEIAQELEKAWTQNKAKDSGVWLSSYNIAVIYAAMPDKQEEAFAWLDKAIGEFDPRVNWLKVDPRFNKLRELNRDKFTEKLQTAGLLSHLENREIALSSAK